MPPKIRKHKSGSEKRKWKKRMEELDLSLRGSLDKFVVREPPVENENNIGGPSGIEQQNVETLNENDNCANGNDGDDVLLNENHSVGGDENNESDHNHPIDNEMDLENENNDGGNNVDDNVRQENNANQSEFFYTVDIFDPRNWDGLDSKMIDILAVKGPKRDLSFDKGPKDRLSKRFSATLYYRVLSNGEKCDREWLVYSKELDKCFCFCCKLFKKGYGRSQLTNEGFGDWTHVSIRLKEHETSPEHFKNMGIWYDLRLRLQKNETIDKVAQKQLNKEKEHWKKVIQRIIAITKFLAKYNLAFRGTNERLYQSNNGIFLGFVETLAEFDPVIQEHVRRITNDEIHVHYLGHNIQNELIRLLGSAIKSEIIKKVKQAKYFSVILDCTPDISHQEQMSLIIRYVDVFSKPMIIEESFLGFLIVNDTSGQGLFDVLQKELKDLGLDIDNVRGQGYDNGANMKGKHQGVQKRLLDINPRAFYTPCGCHSLNLLLCDMANTCGKARDFFGIIQRIYTIFANSTKRWKILKDNVKGLTPKSLSSTRWESRVDSVKAIRFQMIDIREALLQVAEETTDYDNKGLSEAKSLAENELCDFEFLVAIVIWYEILYAVNLVSKNLQSDDMLLDVAIEKIKGLASFFEKYRETGFNDALNTAKEIALEMNVDPVFPQKREIRRKRFFDENPDDAPSVSQSAEESFRVNYFLFIIDQAIVSLKRRFEQFQEYENLFGFLFTSYKLQSLDDESLKSCCANFVIALEDNSGQSDINGDELYVELRLLREFLPRQNMGPLDILMFLKGHDFFPNTFVAYRILLTVPVTVASAERSFSKLKLLKSYMRSTMTQERLNGLAMMAIENDILETIDYEDIIDDFASKNVRRMCLFK
ncbi:uncharacterized protein [Spinacia oleracea]|uniref:TTF-type domain-containing protein n=1 Tax=Spinacia oleracea TaxID=3562 RepID=A0ABM3RPC8_SPIOL|nr:uncharacterized protein LOC130467755 [Spinacia oleracea]XP_056697464.1 uncharacterized protein LOC130471401 [Spinacia oleracea]